MGQVASIIKYEGNNDTFIWKHPCTEFNTGSQLIVHESQEAVFFLNGQALDLFGAGRHTLETQNIPLLGKWLNKATGGESPFHCEVYFINKTVQMGLKWGTDTKVRFIDPMLGVPLEIGACGEMNLMVADSRKLLVKLVGTMKGISWGLSGGGFTKSLQDSFRPFISTAVKTHLASSIKKENINIFEIDENLEKLSAALRQNILSGFEEYGLTIPEFYITTVLLPENDPNFKRMRELHTISLQTKMEEARAVVGSARADADVAIEIAERKAEMERQNTETEIKKRELERELLEAQASAQKTVIESQAMATKRAQEGYTYQQERGFDVATEVAKNEAVGQFTNLGVGLGTMAGIGGAVAGTVGGAMNSAIHSADNVPVTPEKEMTKVVCPKCGNVLPTTAKFCLECGTRIEVLAEQEILCPICGKKTPKGKFCVECGGALVCKCSECGAEVPDGAKFCLECGKKL